MAPTPPCSARIRRRAAPSRPTPPARRPPRLFGKNTFDRLLNQSGAAGIRLYNGVDDDGKAVILMVAVDSNNTLLDGVTQEGFDDASIHCPPVCAN